ncbi:MAG: hypothetical protein HY235_21835 [Acidobacteria bacterium]|nr:hypothetical protein [Acidobacteriota bacterium]
MPSARDSFFPPEYVPKPQPETLKPEIPVPMVYETREPKGLSLRVYSAIHLRVPDSGIKWLDRMIERSRELDRERSPRKARK